MDSNLNFSSGGIAASAGFPGTNDDSGSISRTDPLLGCGNRYYLKERLSEFCSGQKRNNNRTFALVYADINNFSNIIDTFGLTIGDEILRIFSRAIRNVIRNEDVFARTDGNQFAMIIECSSISDCKVFVDKLRTVTSEISLPYPDLHLTANFGYIFSDEPTEPAKLMKDAGDYLLIDKNRIGG